MKIISRKEAKELGLVRFFTGRPCKHGHVAERFASNGVCSECSAMHNLITNADPKYDETRSRWRERNIETVREQDRRRAREWHHANKDRYRENNRAWARKNRQMLRQYHADWREKNGDKIRADRRLWKHGQKSNLLWCLKNRIGSLVRQSFKRRSLSKPTRTEQIIGCSFDFFRGHIEKQFLVGMTWDNRDLWHIDHIVPLSTSITEEDVIALNHFTNLRPLWAADNIDKSDKVLFLI